MLWIKLLPFRDRPLFGCWPVYQIIFGIIPSLYTYRSVAPSTVVKTKMSLSSSQRILGIVSILEGALL